MNNGNELPDGFRRIVSESSGKVTFEVFAGVVNGIKVRKNFGVVTYGSEAAALAAGKHWYADKRGEIRRDRSAAVSISDRDRLVYMEAIERVKPYGKTLLQAVNTAIEVYKAEAHTAPITVSEAVAQFIARKRLENCKPSYISSIGTYLSAIEVDFGNTIVSKVTAAELQAFLIKRDIKPISWNNWRTNLRVFFNFCIKEPNSWMKNNPAAAMAIKKVDDEEVEILTLDQAKKVLKAAFEICPRQVPYLALGMFAGFRPLEADAALWEDVDWEQSSIYCRSGKVRSEGNRHVKMTEAARAFLEPFRKESGSIGTRKFARRSDLKKLSEATGVNCVSDIYRHSFGSYHLAMHKDKPATMHEMGHSNPRTLTKWYRKPVPALVAHAYWSICP